MLLVTSLLVTLRPEMVVEAVQSMDISFRLEMIIAGIDHQSIPCDANMSTDMAFFLVILRLFYLIFI